MKHLLVLIITATFLIISIFFSFDLQAQGFNDVYSRNGNDVWAVGNNGLIIRSGDGGNFWFPYQLGNNNYNSIASVTPYVWIVGDNGDLERSGNIGGTFTPVTVPTTSNLNSIYFLTQSTGWIAGDNGIILKSTDAGASWVSLVSNTTNDIIRIKFDNSNNGAACGKNGTVLITSDGGNTWINSPTPVNQDLFSIDIKGNTIFSCGAVSTVIKSTNRGSAWSILDYKIETRSDVNSLVMLDSMSYFSVGGGGFIRKSTNGGQTFEFKNNPLFADIWGIAFTGPKGWCISRSTNAVIRTADGGNSWSLPAGVTQSFTWELKIPLNFYTSSGNVFASNPANRNEIFVTKSNTIFRSADRGDNWTQISTIPDFPTNSPSNGFLISPKDTNIFLVAMDSAFSFSGKVFRSTDYGQTWTYTFSGNRNSDGCPLEMDPNHPDTVYYAPSDSFLYRSTNFGLTWNQVGSKRFGDICIVEVMENNSNIILTGDAVKTSATLYRSSDYGLTWTNVNDTNAFEIPDIANSKLQPDYVFCTFYEGIGGLKRSTDKGISWKNVNINYLAWAVDLARDDPNTYAYGTWSFNPIYLTYDGGVNFTPTAVVPGGTFALYYYDRVTLFAQMTQGFYRMRINYSVPIGINRISSLVPEKYFLHQNYPNPFNPVTKIKFDLPASFGDQSSDVRLIIYDALGKEVTTLVSEKLGAGSYEAQFNGNNFPSGTYFYKLESDHFSEVKRMVLLK